MENQYQKKGWTGQKQTLAFLLLMTVFKLAQCQSIPMGLQNQTSTPTPQSYELGVYNKTKTQFDGVTHDQKVNYLKMTRDTGVQIPVMTTGLGGTGTSTDFTIMLWFKFNLPEDNQTIMQIFSFSNSATCFISNGNQIICDNGNRQKLQIASDQLKPGLWFHLTLSISSKNANSYLLLQNNAQGQLAIQQQVSSSGIFQFVQNSQSGWQACLGDCIGDLGLNGGIRELVLRNSYIQIDDAVQSKNMQFTYTPDFKAYFRFQDIDGGFNKDEFIDRIWTSIVPKNLTSGDYIGLDLIPNDVCPTTYDQKKYLQFNGDLPFSQIPYKQLLGHDSYSYFFSTTIKATNTSCLTSNPTAASLYCNIFQLDQVFMIYFETINMLRVHFFAEKNYYESASKAFFIPYNQWVTLQLSISRFNGFDLVVADQNGFVFYQQQVVNQDMYSMQPTGKISFFNNFVGYVDHVLLCSSPIKINHKQVDINKTKSSCMYNMIFSEDTIKLQGDANSSSKKSVKTMQVPNKGTEQALQLSNKAQLVQTFYQGPNADKLAGTFNAQLTFDGIACDDGHMTLQLQTADSFFRFNTPSFQMWQSESTIEFWFKITDKLVYTSPNKFYIFSMRDFQGKYPYYEIFVYNGMLYCAPFGSASNNDITMSFQQFTQQNEDQFGWWHISCSYSFQKTSRATLFNTKVDTYQTLSLVGSQDFYPQDSLLGSFGQPSQSNPSSGISGLLIKEVRYWASELPTDQISLYRYRQIDPMLTENTNELLTYLRLASGTYDFENFADVNPSNNYTTTNFQTNSIAFIKDFLQLTSYFYDQVLKKVVPEIQKTYQTVCPLYTYYLDQFCYSEPLNQLLLTIFPTQNKETNSIDWEFSVLNSPTIDTAVLMSLQVTWESNDDILSEFINAQLVKQKFVIPANYLRHESEYDVTVTLSNEQDTFSETQTVKFIPSKCYWYIVKKGDSQSTYEVFPFSPGKQDIQFQLDQMQNKSINCKNFNFFDEVDTLDFDYILIDTTDFIPVPPEVQFTIEKDGTIDLLISATEQEKLPIFRDISIIATIRWKNSQLSNSTQPNTQVFQHVMITIKFEPSDSALVANMIASDTDITQGQVLILDASSSYISNVPESMSTNGLSYQWNCPQQFQTLCVGQNASQLMIPFSAVQDIQQKNTQYQMYQIPFAFTVVVSWTKPDGDIQLDKLTSTVKFWNVLAPQFDILYSPTQVLITDVKNTVFSLINQNFNVSNITEYAIEWTINPNLIDQTQQTVLQNGLIIQVAKGAWSPNTSYNVTAKVTYNPLPQVTNSTSVQFTTKAPPANGNVILTPDSGTVGTKFTVSINGWTSDNPPIVYNLYSTLDSGGLRRGLLLNTGAPVSANDPFTFTSKDMNPIQVEVKDQSDETVNFIEKINYLAPEQTVPNVNSSQSGSSTQQLLSQLQQRSVTSQKVSLIQTVLNQSLQETNSTDVQSNQPSQVNQNLDVSSQILIRKALLNAISSQIDAYKTNPKTQDLKMSDFIQQILPQINSMTQTPGFLNQQTANQTEIVVDKIIAMQDGLFDQLLQNNQIVLDNYIGILSNMNAFARGAQSIVIQKWVVLHLNQLMDQMCNYPNLGSIASNYTSPQSTEIGFQLQQFNKNSSSTNQSSSMQVLDGQYDFSAYNLYNQFPSTTMPGQLCTQVSAINGLIPAAANITSSRLLANTMLNPYSDAVMRVSVYELGTHNKYSLGDLTGQGSVKFSVNPYTFKNNQTVCSAYSNDKKTWDQSLCNSQLQPDNLQMKCTCNAFKSSLISLFTDTSRVFNSTPISFPQPQQATKLITQPRKEIKKTLQSASHVWLISSVLLSFFFLVASAFAYRTDLKDKTQNASREISHNNPEMSFGSQNSNMNHFILEVARELHQPYAEVEFRKHNLFTYRSVCTQSVFLHAITQIHPVLSPFLSYFATQSRLFRFTAYMLQINIFCFFTCFYFNQAKYRITSIRFDDTVIDQVDIKNIVAVSGIGCIGLLPFFSEPICTLLSDVISRVVHSEAKYMDDIQIEVKKRRVCLRYTVIITSLVSCIAMPFWAGLQTKVTPSSNQYCIFASIMGALVGSLLITSFFYIGYNSLLSNYMVRGKCGRLKLSSLFVCHKALRIAQDLKAVQEASKLFTLSDVLPSSLENSERDIKQQMIQRNTTENNRTEPDKDNQNEDLGSNLDEMISNNSKKSKKYDGSELSREPDIVDSLKFESVNVNIQHQVRGAKRGRLIQNEFATDIHQKAKWEEISGNSLTYTEYKAKLGIIDEKSFKGKLSEAKQNNYMRNHNKNEDSSQIQDGSKPTSIACNQQERSQPEASSAEFIDNNISRSHFNGEISQSISQNISFVGGRLDISRNDNLPRKVICSNSAASGQSDFSDIRGEAENLSNAYSSLSNEFKVHTEQISNPHQTNYRRAK